jgi:hypothetical protein
MQADAWFAILPEVTSAILQGQLLVPTPKLLSLPWMEHPRLLGCPLNTDAIKWVKSPSPLAESLKPPLVHGKRKESAFLNSPKVNKRTRPHGRYTVWP